MKIVDIAHEIFTELGSPSDISIPAVAFWVRSNVGTLNNLLKTNFTEDSAHELEHTIRDSDGKDTTVEIGREETSVVKKMYIVHYYDSQIRNAIGAGSWDSVVEISDSGSRIRKVNRSEVGKTLAQIKKEEQIQLDKLVFAYSSRVAAPIQVAGDDTVPGNLEGSEAYVFARTIKNT
ncbi:hypothetical protein CL634_03780 [bacterium]|nr:hypothetical protein [bacterium]|tara:strand:+ start:331 stop:861 length:531 start_codon:yes stop_codon:yes gene_type:complete